MFKFVILGFMAILITFVSCSDVNEPEENNMEADLTSSSEFLSSDLEVLQKGGINLDDVVGVFSISWNQIFRPMMGVDNVAGHAFAIAFENSPYLLPRPFNGGIDMGSVFINYQDNQLELQKVFGPFGGVSYISQHHFFGPFLQNAEPLEFIPNETYQFQVTGSDQFGPINLTLTTPDGLLDITSHENGEDISPEDDLILQWEGGKPDKGIVIHIVSSYNLFHGVGYIPGFRQGRITGPVPLRFSLGLVEILDQNTGEYKIESAQLNEIVGETEFNEISINISQWDDNDVEHENGLLKTVMRNGDRIHLHIDE